MLHAVSGLFKTYAVPNRPVDLLILQVFVLGAGVRVDGCEAYILLFMFGLPIMRNLLPFFSNAVRGRAFVFLPSVYE